MIYNIFVNSPLKQFRVTDFFSFKAPILGDFNLSLTNLGLYALITVFLVLGLHIVANNSYSLIPSKWSIALESAYASVHATISTFSSKPVFGYLSSPYNSFLFRICYHAAHYVREGWFNLNNTHGLVFKLVAVVIICLLPYNPQVTNAQWLIDILVSDPSMLVGTSETVCVLSISYGIGIIDPDLKLRQWIGGVTDGDGNLYISKKGYVEYSVVIEPRDIACLYKLKQRYGGSVKAFANTNAVRFITKRESFK